MWKRLRTGIIYMLMLSLVFELGLVYSTQSVAAADQYDDLREKWKSFLTGGSYSTSDPDVAAKITDITNTAQGYWSIMEMSPTRTYLWSDLDDSATTDARTISSNMSLSYSRLYAMALAYSSNGSSLYHDTSLLADTISGLDWMRANKYIPGGTKPGNWFDWEIGSPRSLNNTTVLLYDNLTLTQISTYMDAVESYSPTVNMTGANRVDKSRIVAVRGILVKSSTKIANARDGLTNVFAYVTTSDGFYPDGSFIQHLKVPYTGGYGAGLLSDVADIVYLLNGSTWQVTNSGLQNTYKWVYDSFEPLMYKGAIMDMSRGRGIARRFGNDHASATSVLDAVIQMSQLAPSTDAANFKSMVKYWIGSDTFYSYYPNAASIYHLVLAKSIMSDAAVVLRGEPVGYRNFAAMDRTVQRRPDYGFALSMSSSRVYNYETVNNENLKGWYTADGMTYLYNEDLGHYSDEYWGLVNKYRLPGTTVDTQTRADKSGQTYLSSKNWVGGSVIAGTHGTAGMELDTYGNTLTARKSWFMFADKIVALGAGINSTDGRTIETIVENRKIKDDSTNVLTVNGTAKSSTLGWSETMGSVNRIHLSGNVPGSDIGYYFPGGSVVKGLRQARTGAWTSVNTYVKTMDSTVVTKNFLTLWFDHGISPSGGSYSYVILPNKTSAQVDTYASNPDITILENSSTAQAVIDSSAHVTGINFWDSVSKTVYAGGVPFLTSNGKASVMTLEGSGGDLEVAVSDPTQANTGTVQLEINKAAASVISADPAVTVTQLQPTIKLSVNVSGAMGKTFKVKLDTALVNENFNAMTIGSAPTGWTLDQTGGVVDIVNDPSSTDKSMRIRDTSNTLVAGATRSFTASATPVTAEFKMKVGTTQNFYYTKLTSGSTVAVRLRTYAGKLQVSNGGSYADVETITPGNWYTIKLVADPATDKADVYFDGVLKQSNVNFTNAVSAIDTIEFVTHSTSSSMAMQVDNVLVTN
ncbi:polysaccharide lyase 8 family protein [Paenibacillus sp. FSL H8-0034]|uniref:polysaccharide lyase 8 family protein n=1 Tax=Paenibacillus sp. FSL H8-0034 TaxID=2954671 RepID=UPI0030F7DF27